MEGIIEPSDHLEEVRLSHRELLVGIGCHLPGCQRLRRVCYCSQSQFLWLVLQNEPLAGALELCSLSCFIIFSGQF